MSWIRDRITPERIARVRRLTALASSLGLTTAQLAIAWILRRKEVSSVITGATRIEQLDENLASAAAAEQLTMEIQEQIEAIFDESTIQDV
jgi:aryl-alcohol dehydrogenase-like predicted oxidoreductase